MLWLRRNIHHVIFRKAFEAMWLLDLPLSVFSGDIALSILVGRAGKAMHALLPA